MIEWQEKFSVNISKIDEQHKTFLELINKLEMLTEQPDFLDTLPILLNEIVEYASLHFKMEEELMEKARFPFLEEHQHQHQKIKDDIYLECKKVIEREPRAMDVIWLYNYMQEWIKIHILEEDMKYVPYLKQFQD